jgi:hypothetical protein
MKIVIRLKRRKDPIARDLRSPKYKMRVVLSKKRYKRIKRILKNELE